MHPLTLWTTNSGHDLIPLEMSGLNIKKIDSKGPLKSHPILFIHGSGAGAWTWENYIGFFSKKGYKCYVLDLRGHHGSKPVPNVGGVSIYDHINDVSEEIKNLENPILFGHSMGGQKKNARSMPITLKIQDIYWQ